MSEHPNPPNVAAGPELVARWLHAATDESVARHVEQIYFDIASEIALRRPRCDASGRCCRFEAWGHRLYVTGLETAYAWVRLNADQRPDLGAVGEARARGGCPFQPDVPCTIHPIRPLGCRVFFCDPTAGEWQEKLYERLLGRLRAVHDALALPYVYAEWRALLESFAATPGATDWRTVTVTGGGSSQAAPGGGTSITVRGVAIEPPERTI